MKKEYFTCRQGTIRIDSHLFDYEVELYDRPTPSALKGGCIHRLDMWYEDKKVIAFGPAGLFRNRLVIRYGMKKAVLYAPILGFSTMSEEPPILAALYEMVRDFN